MISRRSLAGSFVLLAALVLGGCASLQHREPVQVTVAGVESLPGEGMELRLMLKLRVQNPNQAPIDYRGVYVKLDVQGKTFATGVSNTAGSVPGFGEAVVSVPVTVSVLRMVRQVMGVLDGRPVEKIDYAMTGKLESSPFNAVHFESLGDFKLPSSSTTTTGG